MGDLTLKHFNVTNKSSEEITTKICSAYAYKDHILVNRINSKDNYEKCSMYSIINPLTSREISLGKMNYCMIEDNKLYCESEESIYIFNDKTNRLQKIDNGTIIKVKDNTVYYVNNNSAMKYEEGKKIVLYKNTDEYKIRSFEEYGNVLIIYTRKDVYAVVDGKRVASIKEATKNVETGAKVQMKDGRVKTFNEIDFSTYE